ncbi:alpha/beta hydrolase family protein [Rhodococcus sp. NPDC049939]|uniref:alpha/beta hydrolase n=1 Tax=Rhodococcus sp. NPDC049939 TaxID=3155511 RepID=UPI0033CF84CC
MRLAPASAAYVDHIDKIDDRRWDMYVYSPSMDRVIPLQVIRPADASVPRPTLYLLNGAGGGEDNANWLNQTDILDFLADKNANVVIPAEGIFSYYTDWERDDPVLGRNKWTTFLTRELPPVIDSALGADGINAIAGLSMSATSVLDLAIHAPGLYRGVGSYSGCAETSDSLGQAYVRAVVETIGGGDAQNMWGPYDGPGWREHDPYLNAEKLRGLALYISNGSGLPGPYEDPANALPNAPASLPAQIVVGGAIEAATDVCTHQLAGRLHELNIPATFAFRPVGTHSWGYWQDDLHNSWPMLAESMGLPG